MGCLERTAAAVYFTCGRASRVRRRRRSTALRYPACELFRPHQIRSPRLFTTDDGELGCCQARSHSLLLFSCGSVASPALVVGLAWFCWAWWECYACSQARRASILPIE